MIRVLIADDHPIIRRGLRQLIQEQPDMVVTNEAVNGCEAMEMARKDTWDVLVLDIAMPLRTGLEVLQEVVHNRPDMPVLMLSLYAEAMFGIRALAAGAAGYLCKDAALEELISAIRKVAGGGKYVSQTLAEQFAFTLGNDSPRPFHESLSNREYEVMRMMGAGEAPKTIALALFLSVKTVSTYRSRVLVKLSLRNNAELIRYVMEHDPHTRSANDQNHVRRDAPVPDG